MFDREAGAESAHDIVRGGDEAKSGKNKCLGTDDIYRHDQSFFDTIVAQS